jgi:hypothetical protein
MLALSLLPACSGSGPDDGLDPDIDRIACTTTQDCVTRGGYCEDGICRADNECETGADCAAGSMCVADPNFGGLCGDPTFGPPIPGPAWPCTSGADCPIGQGCADGVCKEDGECTTDADCGAGALCYSSNDEPGGICASDRPATNPYCRSDGMGACRSECNSDDTCFTGATCVADLCYWDDECVTADDCTPNHLCEPYFDAGFSVCVVDEDPDCVDDGTGVCRLACVTSADCVKGGGCEADGFCHASNECATDADCDPGLLCWAAEYFGGLCGPERPE